MPYQTGTANTPSDLKTVIETFAVARGWTLASGVLSKSGANIRLTAPNSTDLSIEAALNAAFTVSVAPQIPLISIATGWPVTYFLSGFTDTDNIYCVVNYSVSKFQYVAFGRLLKYGTWTGGTWCSATVGTGLTSLPAVLLAQTPQTVLGGAILVPNHNNGSNGNPRSLVHAEIDSAVWLSSHDNVTPWAAGSPTLGNLINRIPNAWNSQAVLLPYHITMFRPSNKRTLLGEIPHIRMTRIDNHEAGDVITLGSDKWKLWPWLGKNSTLRDGDASSSHSGTIGWAIKYDGP